MNRRNFLVATASLLAAPLAAEAEQPSGKVSLIGLLDFGAQDAARLAWWKAFRQGLHELGYAEGRNIAFEARWAEGRVDRLPALAADLIQRRVDVIVTGGGEAARAATQATVTIPIVMATGADPVRRGIVKSLAHPGGNVTGLTSLSTDLVNKRLALLRELLPTVSRVAVLEDGTANSRMSAEELKTAAPTLGIRIQQVSVHGTNDLERAFSIARKEHALIVVATPALFFERKRIADLALKYRLPTAHGAREYVEVGGLFSYAVRYPDLFRRAAFYVDKILRGANPGDLPIEQPTQFELVINLKTAKALGVTIPPSLLARADQVIE